jgi:hypothetical protein
MENNMQHADGVYCSLVALLMQKGQRYVIDKSHARIRLLMEKFEVDRSPKQYVAETGSLSNN